MPDNTQGRNLILNTLQEKSVNKNEIYLSSIEMFKRFKDALRELEDLLQVGMKDSGVQVEFSDRGDFEAQFHVGGDILVFTLHSNVFNFEESHFLHKIPYVKENPGMAYCSMIQVHNFLADSFKFNRMNDVGYLVARIFVNKEKHFFVEGKRQLGFLYNDFANEIFNDEKMMNVIQSAILYVVDFDLLVPPYDAVKLITVSEKIQQAGNASFKTGKRLGFSFEADSDNI